MSETVFQPVGIMDSKIFGLPVDSETMFSNHKKIYKIRIEKRQRKLIVKLAFLKPFLKRGEKILLVTTGYSPLASAAQYLTGFLFVYLKRSLFIFTNYRIIHIPTNSSYTYKNSIAQIALAGCQSISLKGGNLVVEYGKLRGLEKFKGIAVAERKKLRALLKRPFLSDTKNDSAGRTHLCPRCAQKLKQGKYICENCQLKFKGKLAARIISIFLPGGGYFYIRHFFIGIINALLEIFLLFYITVTLMDTLSGVQESLYYLIPLAVIYLIIKTIAVIHSNHFVDEFIPIDKMIKLSQHLQSNLTIFQLVSFLTPHQQTTICNHII